MENKQLLGSFSGIIAGFIMGIVVSIANVLDVTAYNIIEIASSIFSQEALKSPGIVWLIIGWVIHLTVAMVYGVIVYYILQVSGAEYRLLKGLLIGAIAWLGNFVIIAPIINVNFIANLDGFGLFFSFGLHLLFGAIIARLILWMDSRVEGLS